MNFRSLLVAVIALALAPLHAAEFPVPYNSEKGDPSPIPAAEALAKITLPPGFTATLFAAEPQVVLDGFTVAKENYHNFANGLAIGPDGWLYGRCGGSCPGEVGAPGTPDAERVPVRGGIWRYHPQRKTFEALTHGTTNPWGHDW